MRLVDAETGNGVVVNDDYQTQAVTLLWQMSASFSAAPWERAHYDLAEVNKSKMIDQGVTITVDCFY